jgi:hypothetical protein
VVVETLEEGVRVVEKVTEVEEVLVVVESAEEKGVDEVAVGVCVIVFLVGETEELLVEKPKEGEKEMVDESVAEEEIKMLGERVVVGVCAIALVEEPTDVEKVVIMIGMVVEVCVDV